MSELSALIADTAAKVFAGSAGLSHAVISERIEDAGFRGLLMPEDLGGFGGGLAEVCAVMRTLGGAGVSVPLGDLMLGAWLEAEAGLGDGALPTEAVDLQASSDGVPFAWTSAGASRALGVVEDRIVVTTLVAEADGARSLSGAPLTRVHFDGGGLVESAPAGAWSAERLARWRTAANAAHAAGAVEQCLRLTIDHVTQRKQFGRPLSALQAVQQQVAVLAEKSAAVSAAVDAAARSGEPGLLASAAAALQTRDAATVAVSVAHQLHGAMGFTEEYPLHHYTALLMECRSRGRPAGQWAALVGRRAVARGGAELWSDIVQAD